MGDQELTELLFVVRVRHASHLLNTTHKSIQFLNQPGNCVDKGIVLWLSNQVINRKAAANDIEKQLVKTSCNLKESLVICLTDRLKLLSRLISNHLRLVSVKGLPDAHDTTQVILAHFLKVRLRTLQLFLALFFQDFKVKA